MNTKPPLKVSTIGQKKVESRKPSGIRRFYSFRLKLAVEGYYDFPDVFRPFDPNYSAGLFEGDSFQIFPFVKELRTGFSMLTTSDDTSRYYDLVYEVEDPTILSVRSLGMDKEDGTYSQCLEVKCLRNGKTKLKVRIFKPKSGGFTYTRIFVIIVENPEWHDVKYVNVTL